MLSDSVFFFLCEFVLSRTVFVPMSCVHLRLKLNLQLEKHFISPRYNPCQRLLLAFEVGHFDLKFNDLKRQKYLCVSTTSKYLILLLFGAIFFIYTLILIAIVIVVLCLPWHRARILAGDAPLRPASSLASHSLEIREEVDIGKKGGPRFSV